MKVAVCIIVRSESKYIREWVSYYKDLGFDTIFLYDNNKLYEEVIQNQISDFVDDGFVRVIEWYDIIGNQQKTAYQHCFEKNRGSYDWIAFFDADEYLILDRHFNGIKEYLSDNRFTDARVICVKEDVFDDSDVIENSSNKRIGVFINKSMTDWSSYVKSIVRCGDEDFIFVSNKTDGCHLPYSNEVPLFDYYDADGNKGNILDSSCLSNPLLARIMHFPTGTIEDYINTKVRRGWPDSTSGKKFDILDFFKVNKITDDKIRYYSQRVQLTVVDIINYLVKVHDYKSVLQIGGNKNDFERIACKDKQMVSQKYQADGKFDLIFVDGDHSFMECMSDVVWSTKHLKSGGKIVIHDCIPYTYEETQPTNGVYLGEVYSVIEMVNRKGGNIVTIDTDFGVAVYDPNGNAFNGVAFSDKRVTYNEFVEGWEKMLNVISTQNFYERILNGKL